MNHDRAHAGQCSSDANTCYAIFGKRHIEDALGSKFFAQFIGGVKNCFWIRYALADNNHSWVLLHSLVKAFANRLCKGDVPPFKIRHKPVLRHKKGWYRTRNGKLESI